MYFVKLIDQQAMKEKNQAVKIILKPKMIQNKKRGDDEVSERGRMKEETDWCAHINQMR